MFPFSSDPNSKFTPELLTAIGAGLLSGNTVSQQVANAGLGANTALAAQEAKAKGLQQQNQTVQMLQAKAPELAQAVATGIMTPSDAYGAFLKKQQAEAEAAKPKYQLQNIGGKLVRVDVNKGSVDQLGDFSDPMANVPSEAKTGMWWADHPEQFDAYTKQQATLQGIKAAPTELVRNLEAAGYKQGTPEFQSALMQAMKKPGMSLKVNEDGSTEFVQGDVQNTPKLTVEQGKNAGFLIRASDAQKTLNGLETQGTSLTNAATNQIPVVGNAMKTENDQQYERAKQDFITAVLRKESGAVIGPDEFKREELKYFPQPFDGPKVIADKRRARENVIEGFKISAGPGALPEDVRPSTSSTVKNWSDYFNQGQ